MIRLLFLINLNLYILKKIKTIIYITSLPGLLLATQIFIIIYIYVLLYFKQIPIFFKLFKQIPIFFFFKKINKILFFNKIAIIHIFLYIITIINLIFNNKKLKIKNYYNILLLNITIILGSFWSNMEVLWGGLWNWNITELSILLILILILILFHKKKIKFNNQIILIIFIFIYFYFNRIILNLTIHSFTNNKYLNYTFTFFLPLIIILLIYRKYSIFLIIGSIWLAQIVQLNITLVKFYKYILICLFYFKTKNNSYLLIKINIFLHILQIIQSLNFTKYIINLKFIHILNIYILVFIIILQYLYTLYYIKKKIYKNLIINKTQFSYDSIYLISNKINIWRYKIVTLFNNNIIYSYYY